jgi:hypothetical protein
MSQGARDMAVARIEDPPRLAERQENVRENEDEMCCDHGEERAVDIEICEENLQPEEERDLRNEKRRVQHHQRRADPASSSSSLEL